MNVKSECCKECPFRKDAAQGWLGNAKGPEDFVMPHWHLELPLYCHMTVNWEDPNYEETLHEKPLCRGLLAMMCNSGKLPRSSELAAARNDVGKSESIFSNLPEFIAHHK